MGELHEPIAAAERPLTPEEQAVYDADLQDLKNAEEAHGMQGKLEGRVKFGLDPAGMMVVRDTAPLTKKIAEALGADTEKVWPLIKELHEKGPWAMADRLLAASDAEIRAYIVMADACHESGWPGYKPAAYLEDRKRVIEELSSFTADKFEERHAKLQNRVEGFEELTRTIDGKEIKIAAASNDAALPLSTKGFKGCIVRQDKMRFAQTSEIPDKMLEAAGLVPGFAEVYSPEKQGFVRVAYEGRPAGSRVVWVDSAQAGKPLEEMEPSAKRIAPGFVLTYANEALAIDLVGKSLAEKPE
jgi:hypothetical protein